MDAPLREAIAAYLGLSRGVRCTADQVIVVSGVQQALDLVTRLALKRGDAVWMEDPGYPGATAAFESVGARIVPVRVGELGLDVHPGEQLLGFAAIRESEIRRGVAELTRTMEKLRGR
ncbi:MAG TPA: aminotransferase class I/II-fold pyridoxal phosphate-dependent enzyme [Candidatus Acidoferrum sp.]|nr:aminotransferase class I/II-fold pyridoxal phosphate-dependent enzyme [Candidatus Acidoferrum sp.]